MTPPLVPVLPTTSAEHLPERVRPAFESTTDATKLLQAARARFARSIRAGASGTHRSSPTRRGLH